MGELAASSLLPVLGINYQEICYSLSGETFRNSLSEAQHFVEGQSRCVTMLDALYLTVS